MADPMAKTDDAKPFDSAAFVRYAEKHFPRDCVASVTGRTETVRVLRPRWDGTCNVAVAHKNGRIEDVWITQLTLVSLPEPEDDDDE